MDTKNVVIIGAGLAGLSAAAMLIKRGAKVTVIEQGSDVGGRMATIDHDGGFVMDAGLHCFHYGDTGPLGDLNNALGLSIEYLESNDPGYVLRGKERLPVPAEAEWEPGDVPGFSKKEAQSIHEFYRKIMETDTEGLAGKSVSVLIAEYGLSENELVTSYAGALCLTMMGASLETTSAEYLVSHGRTVGHPGFHVSVIEGGPGRLLRALSELVEGDDSRLVLGSKVQEIELSGKDAVKVVTSSEEIEPAAVIYTGPTGELPDLITGDQFSTAFARTCRRPKPVSAVSVEFGLSTQVSTIAGVMIDPREAVIGRFPTNLDPSLSPDGSQISSWLAVVPTEETIDKKAARSHIKRLKRVVAKQFPELSDAVKWERIRVLPFIGAAPTPKVPQDKRPKVANKQLANLFIAGDAVNSPGVLSGCSVSSAITAVEQVAKLLNLSEQPSDEGAKTGATTEDSGAEEEQA